MAKTQHLKRRIRSVRNTMQVTKAMKMISAARLRKAQDRIIAARPFANRGFAVLRSLASRANPELHPLLQVRPMRRLDVVVVAADRGLCGSFNANILRTAATFIADRPDAEVFVSAVGRKAVDYFRKRRYTLRREWTDVFRRLEFPVAETIGQDLIGRYASGESDATYVVYNEFKSTMQQSPVIERLLPIDMRALEGGQPPSQDYIYEPSAAALFERLLPRHVEVQVFRGLLESAAAEHAARMTAMDSATSNAGELIDRLTLKMNRVRQASITTELIEVVSGAQALG